MYVAGTRQYQIPVKIIRKTEKWGKKLTPRDEIQLENYIGTNPLKRLNGLGV